MAKTGWGFFAKRSRRPQGHVALSLSMDRLALVVRPADGRGVRAYERGVGADMAATLGSLVQEAGAAGMACEWILEPGAYSLQQVDKPSVPPSEWVQALRWKVRDLIGFPIDEAVMDAFEVPGLDSRGRPPTLYLAVARKDELRPRIAQIEAAGLRLSSIGISDLAWAEAVRILSPGEDSVAALVIDARGGSMLAMRENTLFVARRFEFDADDQRVLREPQQGRTERLFERVALELQRTLDYFDRTHQRPPPRRLLLLAGIEGLEGLDASLRNNLGLEVQGGAPEAAWPELAALPASSRVRVAALSASVSGGKRA